MKEKKESDDINSMSFEEALMELEEIVRQLEAGKSSLEDAIKAYERGAALKQHCEIKLREAKARVEKINVSAEGEGNNLEPANLE